MSLLVFVSPCVIIYSNKSTTQMHQSLRFIACRLNTVQHVLGLVSSCIIIHSNKSTNQMRQSLRFIACRLNTAQYVSGILMPIIRSL
jgi:hypothetical protein